MQQQTHKQLSEENNVNLFDFECQKYANRRIKFIFYSKFKRFRLYFYDFRILSFNICIYHETFQTGSLGRRDIDDIKKNLERESEKSSAEVVKNHNFGLNFRGEKKLKLSKT